MRKTNSMNKKYIVICSNIPVFWENKFLDRNWCKQFPGASWMPILAEIAIKSGYEVMSGDIALKNNINPKGIFVIQELNARHGKKLLKKGAIGSVLIACESPIFSYYFYDNISSISKKFHYRKLFNGSFNLIDKTNENIDMFFPSYSLYDDNEILIPWSKRNFSVMVAANKSANVPIPKGLKNQINWFIHKVYKTFSPSFINGAKNELHSKRLEIITYFGKKSKIELFGSGWLDFKRFQKKDLEKLAPILRELNPSFCENKINTIKKYKFIFCLENISYDGYVTEKIIDCLVASVIPIYLGAPNITDFVPKDCFINLREFKTIEELEKYLDSISEEDAMKIISNGQSFLSSQNGRKFSNEYFANDILKMVKSIDDNN